MKKLTVTQQMLLARRLAIYLRSGITINSGLLFILEDARSEAARILSVLESTVASGQSLSQGLSLFPSFDTFSIGFVRAGETSGTLSETLERLAEHLQKRHSLRKKILGALSYPLIILIGTVLITLFLTLFIFPKILPVLQGLHTSLPLSTRILIGINTLLETHWLFLLLGLCTLSVIFIGAFRRPFVKIQLERLILRIPIIGLLCQYYSIAIFTRTLALQLSGGVSLLPALALTSTALSGSVYRKGIAAIEAQISEGQKFSTALKEHPKLFPPIIRQMISAGEETGTLSANLSALANMYEENLDDLTKSLTVLVEPVLMVVMGFIVGFVALAIITPIYQVTQNLNVQ
jgi:type IV pilus assembly protein PilC